MSVGPGPEGLQPSEGDTSVELGGQTEQSDDPYEYELLEAHAFDASLAMAVGERG